MRLNRRFLSTLLALCMVMSLAVPASAANLSATYGEAVYSDIGIMTYSRMLEVQNGVFPVANEEGLCALVDTNGKAVTAYEYDYISILGGGYFKVVGGESGYEEGIIDSTGKVIRELSDCTVYEKGNAICIATYVEDQGYVYEYFDLSMKPTSESVSRENGLIPTALTVYDECWESNGYYFVGNYTEDDYEMGLFDANCSVVFPIGQYSGIDVVEIGGDVAFMVNTDDGAALLNEKRETVIAAGTYDSIWYDAWEDNFITVTSGDLYGAVDTNGKLIVSLGEYDEICNVNEDGYISALSYDGYGSNITNIVTKLFKNGAEVKTYEGKMVETVEYSDNFIFSTGAAVGMMDMSGKVILEEKYADIGGVVEDDVCTGELITRVKEKDSWNYLYGLYNADGKQLLEEKYGYLSYIADGKYKAQSNDKYGIITCTGEVVIPFNYSQIDIAASAVAGLYDGTNYSLVDLKGNVIVPATPEQITIFGGFNVAGVNGLRAEAERYEGYTDAIYPVNYKAADGWKTVYIDFADGSVLAKIDQRVSNINEDGYFAYQTESGLYGIGKATLSDDPAPVEPAPKPSVSASGTAYASTQNVEIDGKAVEVQAYALKDANGNPTNYVKLRDVAMLLNGSAAQFEVSWDGAVNIVTGQSYTANGSEMFTPFSGDRSYTVPTAATKINGEAANLSAITLTDDNGGGYTYYQLRDLGRSLGFNVGWSAERGIYVETDKAYVG